MALQPTDLFVVQSQTDGSLYQLQLSELAAEIEASDGIQFRGIADLNISPIDQADGPITIPAVNGDMYLVTPDALAIHSGWAIVGGETEAFEGDRIVYDTLKNGWHLISATNSTAGTVKTVTATTPLQATSDNVNPVISVLEARTTNESLVADDGLGTAGVVQRLAQEDDVEETTGTGDRYAVVTADLLKAANEEIKTLQEDVQNIADTGVVTVSTDNLFFNNALTIAPTSGDVKIELKNAGVGNYGVVGLADANDLEYGNAGPGAVVDAKALKEAVENGINSIEYATTIDEGLVRFATAEEVTNAVSTDTVVAPADVQTLIDAIEYATTTDAGLVRFATADEVTNAVSTDTVVTPADVQTLIDAIDTIDGGEYAT